MCFDRENNRQITEYPLYLHEDEKGNSEIIGRKGRKVRRLEMGGGMPEGGAPYQQLVTDGEGNTKWEDRLAYTDELAHATLKVSGDTFIDVYRVSADIPDFLQNAAAGDDVTSWAIPDGTEWEMPDTVSYVSDECVLFAGHSAFVALKNNANAINEYTGEVHGVLPKKGVYFAKTESLTVTGIAPAGTYVPEITWDGQTSVVKQIDPKYLPEGGAPYQQLVTDGKGNAKWEDRLAYEGELQAFSPYEGLTVYRVADVPGVLPSEGDSVAVWVNAGGSEIKRTRTVSPSEYEGGSFEKDGYINLFMVSAVIILRDNVSVRQPNGEYTKPFPRAGIYFMKADASSYVSGYASSADATAPEITWDGQTSVVKQIDPKYVGNIVLSSPNGTKYTLAVADDGTLSAMPAT